MSSEFELRYRADTNGILSALNAIDVTHLCVATHGRLVAWFVSRILVDRAGSPAASVGLIASCRVRVGLNQHRRESPLGLAATNLNGGFQPLLRELEVRCQRLDLVQRLLEGRIGGRLGQAIRLI